MEMVAEHRPIKVRLNKDLTRSIKRGHAWLFSHAVETPSAPAGTVAWVHDRSGDTVATGIYDPEHPIPLRICATKPPFELDDAWLARRLERALKLRASMFGPETTGQRLVAGEGDGLPGLIIDRYSDIAVMKLDGGAPSAFYQPQGIADWLVQNTDIQSVVLRSRERGTEGESLVGEISQPVVEFLENGMRFTADVIHGQKTGFFLDQRENRDLVRRVSSGKTVLNLFSFNGGFSVAAGKGHAASVTSVDLAAPAIAAADEHWEMNQLEMPHQGIAGDCFDFLGQVSSGRKKNWDIVICDPPSFAPSEKARDRALAAYAKLAQMCAKVTAKQGLLALASCSSHIDRDAFSMANLEGIGRARRQATLIADKGLPTDHVTPLAMPELRYLKFQLLQLD